MDATYGDMGYGFAMDERKVMIDMKQLMLRYRTGKVALSGVNLTIPQGQFVYLTGESGAGKSSLLRMFYGGLRPTSGQLFVQDTNMREAGEKQVRTLRRRTGVCFQDQRLLFSRTVFENVALPLHIQGWNRDRLIPRVRKVLAFVRLEDRLWSYPEALSGGEQQRVAIARAMMATPPIVLADEPTGNLDSKNSEMIFKILREIDATVLVVTHDKSLINPTDHIITMKDGKILC